MRYQPILGGLNRVVSGVTTVVSNSYREGLIFMITRPLAKLAAGMGGLAIALSAGAGLAAAQPSYDSMVDSPCTYDQAMRAVHTENPMAAQYLDQSPPNLKFLQVFLSSPREERVSLLNQIKNNQGAAQALPVFQQTLTNCANY